MIAGHGILVGSEKRLATFSNIEEISLFDLYNPLAYGNFEFVMLVQIILDQFRIVRIFLFF